MSMARFWSPPARFVRGILAGTALVVGLSFTSCGRLRTPEELLRDPGSSIDPRAAARAEELYQRNCSICHGETGVGNGLYFASGLEPTPADLTQQGPDALDRDNLQKWIRKGSAGFGRSVLCPSWGYTFTDEEIVGLAGYVLSLRRSPAASSESESGDEGSVEGADEA